MTQTLPTILAYYGKLPARGDFVGRRLPRETIALWDDWLQQAVAASREAIGTTWLDLYLVSPLWRFFLPAGLCGAKPLAGVAMPSVDRVGRAFPMMIAAELDAGTPSAAVLAGAQAWFEAIEALALSALAEDFPLDRLDAPIASVRSIAVDTAMSANDLGDIGCCLPLDGPEAARILAENSGGSDRSFWWTIGSEKVAPVLVLARGLPAPEGFAAFIDGDWAGWGWRLAASPDNSEIIPAASGALPSLEAELLPWDREE
ncbi:MAG TPA: type VI secretion system-associated protein TagF [Aliidongia sp.]|uniref:type VI secretion system-associated protein TagF n=1 Tax=Aliidongia sp. TaxID=1914230 RepID=UPI002DDD04C3|nr:type VI secretion system-associated protein TagF [Aliidongia sp.]HEV2674189.1 type VI secretion system-associated protein TagF [Aliidongia sp.]